MATPLTLDAVNPHPWTLRRRATPEALAALGVSSPLLAQLLLNRGIGDPDEVAAYLHPPRPQPPALDALAGLEAAVARIERALDDREPIVIYGDYDVDGLSGATLLQRALTALGGSVDVFIPHRDRDGYGLAEGALTRLADRGTRLVITVDCGVTAAAEVAIANGLGLDVVVTDHHEVPVSLPAAAAVVNPRRPDCPYPFKQLAGVGVALKVAQALIHRRLTPAAAASIEPSLFELAALGTVSDIMPLVDENRAIVRHGLAAINERPSAGVAALIDRAGLSAPWIDSIDVAFRIAPRLNAAGRIDDATLAQHVLAASDRLTADRLAHQLEALNDERKGLTTDALADAREQVLRFGDELPPALVLVSPFPAGVLGLVAVKLVEETGRPVAVIEETDGPSRGSVRAPKAFDVVGAVAACAEHLLRYGGHAGAAGFSLEATAVPAFTEAFVEATRRAPATPLTEPGPTAECRLRPETLDLPLLDVLQQFGPFGASCPEPLFETSGLLVREARIVGERHLRMRLFGGGRLLTAIHFGGADNRPHPGSTIDILYRARPNVWQGQTRVDLQAVQWRYASRQAPV
jgi:single-stranded-DNA-specific exonuclease